MINSLKLLLLNHNLNYIIELFILLTVLKKYLLLTMESSGLTTTHFQT